MNAITRSEAGALRNLGTKLAARFGMGDTPEVLDILKATVFKTRDAVPTDAQMTALLIVANQYGLNPWTKEIYAYPDKQNGIVPVVGVDGWARIINEHPQLDGIEFAYSPETVDHRGKACHAWIECLIYRKDRTRPIVVREYFAEVVRSLSYSTPWDTHPNRMHRHKTLIQCARIAFGFAGIFDDDEAERIAERHMGVAEEIRPATLAELPPYPADQFDANFPAWSNVIASGRKSADQIIAMDETKARLTDEQKQRIRQAGVTDVHTGEVGADPAAQE